MASTEFGMILDMLAAWRQSSGLDGTRFDIEALRATMQVGAQPAPVGTNVVAVEVGGRPAEWLVPEGVANDRRLLYLHGGGYVAGGLDSHRALAADIAKAGECAVLLLDYRLAPEHPFPAAIEDATTALQWMCDHGPDAPAAASRLYVGGDSAGGGLTLATMLSQRDRGGVLPNAAFTISAYADLSFSGESIRTRADADPMIAAAVLPQMAAAYLGETDTRDPLASPVHADLAGLPPLYLQVGDAEVLLDDSIRVAERARAAGVDARVEVWPEMFHVWQAFAAMLPEGREAVEKLGAFLREH
jgi:monoterpene epsilon-lactone hydrolase